MPAFVPPPPPATLTIGHSDKITITRAALAIDGRHATLTLVLTTAVRERSDVALPISIPHGAAITGLAVVEADHRTIATAQPTEHAYASYLGTVAREIDPVLLAYQSSTREQDALQLSVFPLAKAAPVTVEIAIELPDARSLVVDPDDGVVARLEVTTPGGSHLYKKLRAPAEVALPEGHVVPAMSLVNADTALYAEPHLEVPVRDPRDPAGLRTAAQVRAGLHGVMPMLVRCADEDPLPHVMSFVIAPDGTVSDVAGVDDCYADAIKAAHFAAAREATVIRYPLSWDVSR